jgi:hypothetical protein
MCGVESLKRSKNSVAHDATPASNAGLYPTALSHRIFGRERDGTRRSASPATLSLEHTSDSPSRERLKATAAMPSALRVHVRHAALDQAS